MTDIGKIGSSVLGIAGMGIGIGLLAHTANNLTRMTDRMYEPAPTRRPSRPPQRRPVSYRPSRTRSRSSMRKSSMFYNPWY